MFIKICFFLLFQLTNLAAVSEWVDGVAKCPYNPAHNTTALMTHTGDMYSATVTDFTARDPAIYRLMGPSKILRTVQHNSRWLNGMFFWPVYLFVCLSVCVCVCLAIYRLMGPTKILRTVQHNSRWLNGMFYWLIYVFVCLSVCMCIQPSTGSWAQVKSYAQYSTIPDGLMLWAFILFMRLSVYLSACVCGCLYIYLSIQPFRGSWAPVKSYAQYSTTRDDNVMGFYLISLSVSFSVYLWWELIKVVRRDHVLVFM